LISNEILKQGKVEKSNKKLKVMKRKSFGSIYAKVYTGPKSVNIHFKPAEKSEALKFARMILQAVEYGKTVDIATFTGKKNKKGKVQITVTGL